MYLHHKFLIEAMQTSSIRISLEKDFKFIYIFALFTHILLISAVEPQTEMTEALIRTTMTCNFSSLSSSFTDTTSSSWTDSAPIRHKTANVSSVRSDQQSRFHVMVLVSS